MHSSNPLRKTLLNQTLLEIRTGNSTNPQSVDIDSVVSSGLGKLLRVCRTASLGSDWVVGRRSGLLDEDILVAE